MKDTSPVERSSSDEGASGAIPDERLEPEEQEFFMRRHMSYLWVAAAMALTVLTVWMAIRGPSTDSAFEAVFGHVLFGIVALFSATATVRVLGRVKAGGPSVVFDREGITDQTGPGSPVFVPWDDIVSLGTSPHARAGIELKVRDLSSLKLTRLRRWSVRMIHLIRQRNDVDLVIPVAGLDVPSKTIVTLAHDWMESRLLEEVRHARGEDALESHPDGGALPEGEDPDAT